MSGNAFTAVYDNGPITLLGYDRAEFKRRAKRHCKVCKGSGMTAELFNDLRGYPTSSPLVPCDCTGHYDGDEAA